MVELHPALMMAREARRAPESQRYELAPPNVLHGLSRGDRKVYNHAMIEAGHVIRRSDGRAFDPCPECGYSFAS